MTTYTLIYRHNINPRTIHNLKHSKGITTATLEQLCSALRTTLCVSFRILMIYTICDFSNTLSIFEQLYFTKKMCRSGTLTADFCTFFCIGTFLP